MDNETIDTPLDNSSFLRHFNLQYEKLNSLKNTHVTTYLDSDIGFYKSTVNHQCFPFLNSPNPIEPKLSKEDLAIFKMVDNYEDLFCYRRMPDDNVMRIIYCTHAVNHSLKSRKLVIKNNEKEKQRGVSDEIRDQGFHRARTLILAPTKESARKIVHTFLNLMPKGSTVSHRRRFEKDFGPQPGETDAEKKRGHKPKDYEEWFNGNSSDHFRIGISFSKKSVKLYSAFAESDVILASPLGLQTIIDEGKDKETDLQYIIASVELLIIDQAEMLLMQNWTNVQRIISNLNQKPTKPVFKSAARIRLAYLAGYGRYYRQTLLFSAIQTLLINLIAGECENFQGINYIPCVASYALYPTYLNDYYRVPGLKSNRTKSGQKRTHSDEDGNCNEMKTACCDLGDLDIKLNLLSFIVSGEITISNVSNLTFNQPDLKATTDEQESDDVTDLADPYDSCGSLIVSRKPVPRSDYTYLSGRNIPITRLNTFKQRVLPRLRKGVDPGVLIYVPDFYDLEELRHLLHSESLDFCCVSEYTDDTEAERFRTLFSDGRIRIMLLSERYHFFRRRKIRGAQTFIFYGPPTFPWFVKELLASYRPPRPTENQEEVANRKQTVPINVTILYHNPHELHLITMITGKIDM